ncbi:DUF4142 domain-containing protein [Streptomyces sp. NPDC006551]|uniref:DUF4142 domain-containing protein n=1 Tax=Streptomyces sp. NPDC006551 TaxID=3157178 RepID=UPI0033A2F551
MRKQFVTVALIAAAGAMCASQAYAAPGGDQDTAFTKAAHQANLAEIAAGRDGQKNATTACVKTVADTVVRDHSRLDAGLTALAKKHGIALPSSPAPEDKQKLMAVRAKAGTAAYDKAWLADQDAAHTKSLARIDEEIAKGDHAEIVAAARAARPIVATHLDMVRGGTCHAAKDPKTVRAGSGGHLAAAMNDRAVLGTAALAGGWLIVAGAGLLALRGRRRDAES